MVVLFGGYWFIFKKFRPPKNQKFQPKKIKNFNTKKSKILTPKNQKFQPQKINRTFEKFAVKMFKDFWCGGYSFFRKKIFEKKFSKKVFENFFENYNRKFLKIFEKNFRKLFSKIFFRFAVIVFLLFSKIFFEKSFRYWNRKNFRKFFFRKLFVLECSRKASMLRIFSVESFVDVIFISKSNKIMKNLFCCNTPNRWNASGLQSYGFLLFIGITLLFLIWGGRNTETQIFESFCAYIVLAKNFLEWLCSCSLN